MLLLLQVLKIYEVYHFEAFAQYDGHDPDTGLFTGFINCFLKLKTEASGWPGNVKTQEEKDAFIMEYREKEGIELDPAKMEKNPAARQLAKLMLNSFWG